MKFMSHPSNEDLCDSFRSLPPKEVMVDFVSIDIFRWVVKLCLDFRIAIDILLGGMEVNCGLRNSLDMRSMEVVLEAD